MTIDQAIEQASALHQAGRLADAEALYRAVLAQQPNHPDALGLLGLLHHQLGQHAAAEPLLRRAIACNPPASAHHHHNLGLVLTALGRTDDALAAYLEAVQVDPSLASSWLNAGIILQDAGRLPDAAAAYQNAARADPTMLAAHNNLGTALRDLGRVDDAIAAYRAALAIDPQLAEAMNNLALALTERGDVDAGARLIAEALALHPQMGALHATAARIAVGRAQLGDALAAFRRAVELAPANAELHSELILALEFDPSQDDRSIAAEQRRWDQRHADPVAAQVMPHPRREPAGRLRVGYVSADFRAHPVGRHVLPLLHHRDRDTFEVFCYSAVVRADATTRQFQSLSDHWRSVLHVSDDAVAQQIRADAIDILVDLSLHTVGNRLPVFARKPAPMQVSFAGYPGSTGVPTIDYRITDRWLEPDDSPPLEAASREWPVRLPDSFWCYDLPGEDRDMQPAAAPPALANGYITFGCLGHVCKINAGVLDRWAAVLRSVPRSRMFIMAPAGQTRDRLTAELVQRGVSADHVEFVPTLPRRAYLESYRRVDLVLDTDPYNGHTTTLDALWMGVPVVSLAGRRPVSRGGLSILSTVGLADLVTATDDGFVQTAVALALDVPRLTALHATLRDRLRASPLMDTLRFTQNIEAAYREMWRRSCAGSAEAAR